MITDRTPIGYGKPLERRPTPAELVRILAKIEVDRETGCWLWTGCKDDKGYGRVKFAGKSVWIHRLMAQTFHSQFPPRVEANHKPECRNPTCCNPDHLEPMTKSDNTADGNRRRGMPAESDGSGFDW